MKGIVMNVRKKSLMKTLALLVAGLSISVCASPVEIYSNAVWVAGDGSAQVETIGTLKYAYACGYTNGYPSTIDVNGKEGKTVTFITTAIGSNATTNGLGSDIDFSKFVTRAVRDAAYQPVGAITGNYRIALRDIYYVSGAGGASYVMTLKNLAPGRTYLVQVWASDGYGAGDRQVLFTLTDGTHTNAVQLDTNNGNANKGEGQVATFKAVAESSSMTLTLNSAGTANNMACFSAIQVRDVSPMYWTVPSGNWNTSGTNWNPAVESDIYWNSSVGPSMNAYFTNNATVTLTADVWARDLNVVSNTTIKRESKDGTTTLTLMRNLSIDANRTLTLGDGVSRRQTAIVVSNAVTGLGSVDVKGFSRIVLGNNALGSVNASINGDGGNYKGGIQSANYVNAEWSGPIVTSGTVGVPARVGAGINGVLTISGMITGNTLGIRSEASVAPIGIVKLTNAGNTYTNDTVIYTPLRIGCNNAIPVASKWSFNAAVANGNPSVDLNGYNQEVQDFVGAAIGSNITNSSVTASVLTVSNAVAQTASVLRVTGNLSVVKRGGGTLTLGATNTYSGTTTIEAGTLALSAAGEIASTNKLILSGGGFDISAKSGYILNKPLQVTTNSSVTGSLTLGAKTELTFDGATAALAGGTITMAGQALKLTTTATLAAGTDYPLISGYTGTLPSLDTTALSVPDGATASLVLAGGVLSLRVAEATTDTTTTLATVPVATGTYGDNIILTATVSPGGVPEETTVNLYAASDLDTVIDSGVVTNGVMQFTVVKPAVGTYSYVAKFMGGGIYRPSQSEASSTVTIQQKVIAISAISAADKLHDGLTNAVVQYTASGVLAGEPDPVSCVGYFSSPEPGGLKTVNLTWTMNNFNYVLSGNNATVNANIYEYAVWTGTAGDGLWHTASNWDHQIVPNSQAVSARFDAAATVTLGASVYIKRLVFTEDVTLNGAGTFTFPPQYKTGEVVVATGKVATFNAQIASAFEGIPKRGQGTLVLVGNHAFGGPLDVQEGVAEINQTTPGALTARNYNTAFGTTLRFVCAPVVSVGTQLQGTRFVTGDGTLEVVSGYLRVQSNGSKVSVSMGSQGQILVRSGAKMDNSNAGGDRYAANKAKLVVEEGGYYGLNADTVKMGSLQGAGEVKADWDSRTLTITGDSDGAFAGTLTEKDAANRLSFTKSGLGTQTLSGTNQYTGATTVNGGRLTLAGGDNRLSVNTQVVVTNAVLDLGMTQQTFNNNPVFRSESTLAVSASKTTMGRLAVTNSIDVSEWKVTINNPNDYPKGKRFAVISTGADKIITGKPALVDMPSGFIIYNQNNTIYVDSPAMVIFFK